MVLDVLTVALSGNTHPGKTPKVIPIYFPPTDRLGDYNQRPSINPHTHDYLSLPSEFDGVAVMEPEIGVFLETEWRRRGDRYFVTSIHPKLAFAYNDVSVPRAEGPWIKNLGAGSKPVARSAIGIRQWSDLSAYTFAGWRHRNGEWSPATHEFSAADFNVPVTEIGGVILDGLNALEPRFVRDKEDLFVVDGVNRRYVLVALGTAPKLDEDSTTLYAGDNTMVGIGTGNIAMPNPLHQFFGHNRISSTVHVQHKSQYHAEQEAPDLLLD